MSNHINWDLINNLYNIEQIYFIMEVMVEQSLRNSGWVQDRAVTRLEYKKMWAVSACCEPLSDLDTNKKIQWGYDIIDKHFTK